MPSTFNKFQSFVEAVAEKVHNLGSDTLKAVLTNAAPTATHTVKADLTEIAAGNGYTAGGPTMTQSSSAQVAGTYTLKVADATVTASGGPIGPLRTATLVNDTAASDELVGAWDYGSSITLAVTESLDIDADAAAGIATLA